MRRSSEKHVRVQEYRGNAILLNTVTSRFVVEQIAEIDVADVKAARAAIDKHIAESNKGVRRKVLTWENNYGDDAPRSIKEGELTSWSRARRWGGVEGIVSYGKNSRDTFSPDRIFESTAGNRKIMEEVVELERQIKRTKALIEKKEKGLERAKQPASVTATDKAT